MLQLQRRVSFWIVKLLVQALPSINPNYFWRGMQTIIQHHYILSNVCEQLQSSCHNFCDNATYQQGVAQVTCEMQRWLSPTAVKLNFAIYFPELQQDTAVPYFPTLQKGKCWTVYWFYQTKQQQECDKSELLGLKTPHQTSKRTWHPSVQFSFLSLHLWHTSLFQFHQRLEHFLEPKKFRE